MFKSLKNKITLIYLFLVFTIAIVGLSSVYNFYKLSKSINGLMVDNYRSIDAINHMLEALEDQNIIMQNFIYTESASSLEAYYQGNSNFFKWYNTEVNNITESGEKELVSKINNEYLKYEGQFSELQDIKRKNGELTAFQFYNDYIIPTYNQIRSELRNVTSINETAMFNGKSKVTTFAKNSMYVIGILSLIVILIGFVLSSALTSKFLKPLYVLKENMKSLKAGNLELQLNIKAEDEIGELAAEFDKMTIRLKEFEKSTKGMLVGEKNRSIAIIKSISDPVIVLDTYYRVILLNHASEIFFQIEEKEAISKHILEIIKNSEVYDQIVEVFNSTEEKHKPKIISLNVNSKDFFFDTVVTKIRDNSSKINGVVVLFQNVTKLKKLEKAKTEFVSTISHEFKTPLTSIMMGISLMKNNNLGSLNEKQKEIVATIEDDTERLTTLVNDVIQLSKIQSDRELFSFQPCSLFGIVENSIKGFIDITDSKGIKLESQVEEKLPKVMADYEKISWVINNLISNAVKFTNAGDYIIIKAKVNKNMMYVSVKDSGIGIPEEYTDKIFDKFEKYQLNGNETKGTGLGLTISKEIVNIHKGTIWCESKLGEGSTFTFTVPLAD